MGALAQNSFKTPQQVMAERVKQQQSMYASAQSPYERMGMAIGNILGGALGVKDPEMERASLTQSIYNDTLSSVSDITSPDFYTTLSKNLASAGLLPEAAYSAQEARKYKLEELELSMKQAKAGRDVREAAQKNVKFYKENPDQAEFRIAELAEIIKTDPGNEAALEEYNKIARAASEGAIEATGKAEKETVDLAKNKAQLAKYNKELKDAEKFGPAERWDAEREAAIALLKVNNINPTDDLDQKTVMLNPEIVQAQKLALRTPLGTKQQQTPAYGTNQPTAAPASAPAGTVDFNALPR